MQHKIWYCILHKTVILSKEQWLDSSSLSSESYVLALVWPCLDITSLERNVNRIRPIPTQLPPNSSFSPPLLRCRATWSFPCTRHNLWLRFGGWRCVCATLLFQASGAPCAAVLRIQEKSVLGGWRRLLLFLKPQWGALSTSMCWFDCIPERKQIN